MTTIIDDVYRPMRTKNLLGVREALAKDMAQEGTGEKTRAFCAERIATIDQILEARARVLEPRVLEPSA